MFEIELQAEGFDTHTADTEEEAYETAARLIQEYVEENGFPGSPKNRQLVERLAKARMYSDLIDAWNRDRQNPELEVREFADDDAHSTKSPTQLDREINEALRRSR